MKQFSLLKTSEDNYPYIIDVLKLLLGNNIHIEYKKSFMVIEHNFIVGKELEETIKTLESDLNTLITFYLASSYSPLKELRLIIPEFSNLNYGHYDLKSVIPQIENHRTNNEIFRFIVDGIGIDEKIILAMAENDLNVSKASQSLFMHRNTLLYKIDRLNDLRGFDLKKFYDLYLLIYLLKA